MVSVATYLPWSGMSNGIKQQGSNPVRIDELLVTVGTNPGGENPFWVQHKTLEGSLFYNKNPPPRPKLETQVLLPGPSSWLQKAGTGMVQPTFPASELWARTNPTRPVMHLPVFWLETREIPDMLRQAGRFLLHAKNWKQYVRTAHQSRDLATANLAFQFGWQPLIGDLYKLATFQDVVEKRRKEILKASSGKKGYRRRIGLGGGSKQIVPSGSNTANYGAFLSFPVKDNGAIESWNSWAVMKWRPTRPNVGIPTKDGDLRSSLLGLHPSNVLENVWEALPWSWLIDYFTGIGDMLAAGNHHFATPVSGSVMTTSVIRRSHEAYLGNLINLTAGVAITVSKRRTPVATSISDFARIPTLGAGQLSILGSLALVKGRKTLGS